MHYLEQNKVLRRMGLPIIKFKQPANPNTYKNMVNEFNRIFVADYSYDTMKTSEVLLCMEELAKHFGIKILHPSEVAIKLKTGRYYE